MRHAQSESCRARFLGGSFLAEEEEDEPEDELEDEPEEEEEEEEESESESESESDELEEEEEEESGERARGGGAAAAAAAIRLGASARCCRRPSVRPPRPMAVQKLIAKRVFFGVSLGKRPRKEGAIDSSLSRWRSVLRPMYSAVSWKRILMKMREDEVVSSSEMTMYSSTPHGSASECNTCANSFATLRSLFVSRRWIIVYCLAKSSSKQTW
mmetsp:Transcript_5587/g.18266  ORF Transcript_5587/g.18266 Transcript_5587/m.18266 type:complete len:213 (-) Transcript_5587:275-913(-)